MSPNPKTATAASTSASTATIHAATPVINSLLTACIADGIAVSIPIGHVGLAAVGHALLECAVTATQDASEKAGAELGMDLVQELYELRGRPQAESFKALHRALLALVKQKYPERAYGGFAGDVVNVLEVGITNLAEGEPE